MPETSYAPCGDLSLAYQVFGDGPIELVWAGSFASHVELYWSMPEFASLMVATVPTPGPRGAMRRSDRAVAVMAKRTPWILRRVSLLSPAAGRKP